jgi:hypothetical protein
MLREAVAKGTPVGLKAKAVMEAGELVNDAIVSALIGEELDQMPADQGAIFDGYPRTSPQAASLETILAARGRALSHVIELEVDEIGPSLRYATAAVTRAPGSAASSGGNGDWSAPAGGNEWTAPAAPVAGGDPWGAGSAEPSNDDAPFSLTLYEKE